MNEYNLKSKDLNNSLVFYRALFNKMPDLIEPSRVSFSLNDFKITLNESQEVNEDFSRHLFYEITDETQLSKTYKRMKRFLSPGKIAQNCEVLSKSVGLVDLDGYKWIIGAYDENTTFEKCYTEFFN
jgi:hypothetical protein